MSPSSPWAVPLDPGHATPVYLQLAQALEARIQSGELPPGSALPGEREWARTLGVSRVTLRQALGQLAERGLLTRRRGSGTYVQGPAPGAAGPAGTGPARTLGLLSSFSEDARARGQTPGAQVLAFTHGPPTPHEAMTLGLSPGERVYRVRRLRTADGEALAVEESTLPATRTGALAREDLADASLYALLAARGLHPQRAIRHLRAVNAPADLAALLGVPRGAALVATERVSWTAAGLPIEYARAHYRGDRHDFVMELQGGETGSGIPT